MWQSDDDDDDSICQEKTISLFFILGNIDTILFLIRSRRKKKLSRDYAVGISRKTFQSQVVVFHWKYDWGNWFHFSLQSIRNTDADIWTNKNLLCVCVYYIYIVEIVVVLNGKELCSYGLKLCELGRCRRNRRPSDCAASLSLRESFYIFLELASRAKKGNPLGHSTRRLSIKPHTDTVSGYTARRGRGALAAWSATLLAPSPEPRLGAHRPETCLGALFSCIKPPLENKEMTKTELETLFFYIKHRKKIQTRRIWLKYIPLCWIFHTAKNSFRWNEKSEYGCTWPKRFMEPERKKCHFPDEKSLPLDVITSSHRILSSRGKARIYNTRCAS